MSSAGVVRPAYAAEPACLEVIAVMAARGLDVTRHRSRTVTRDDVAGADVILGMAREHVRHAVVLLPDAWQRAFTLRELVRRGGQAGARAPGEPLRRLAGAGCRQPGPPGAAREQPGGRRGRPGRRPGPGATRSPLSCSTSSRTTSPPCAGPADRVEAGRQLGQVAAEDSLIRVHGQPGQQRRVNGHHLGVADERMAWPVVDLVGAEQVLGQLLAWPQAGIDDLNAAGSSGRTAAGRCRRSAPARPCRG